MRIVAADGNHTKKYETGRKGRKETTNNNNNNKETTTVLGEEPMLAPRTDNQKTQGYAVHHVVHQKKIKGKRKPRFAQMKMTNENRFFIYKLKKKSNSSKQGQAFS